MTPSAEALASSAALISAVLARLPTNHGLNYPYAEAVLINCRLEGIPPVGWGPVDGDTSHLHLWEFNSTEQTANPWTFEAPSGVDAAFDARGRENDRAV